MVKVIGRDQSVVKRTTCRDCASILEYTMCEVRSYISTDYTGGRDTYYYIDCPRCQSKVRVERYA